MIKEITMYQCVCDNCGKACVDEYYGYIAQVDESSAWSVADDNGWHRRGDKHYCEKCINEIEEA